MYDWANSVYSLVVTSSLFPVYYGIVAKSPTGSPDVEFLGFTFRNSALFSFAVSFSFLVIGLANPWLTALSDIGNLRKKLLTFFCVMGSAATAALAFFHGQNLEFGIFLFVTAAIGYSGSIVFYNSYLPTIATPDQYDRVSGRGFAFGYIGSVILLLVILLPVLAPVLFQAINPTFTAVCRVGFVLTGVWWLGFGLRSINGLPPDASTVTSGYLHFRNVLRRLQQVWQTIRSIRFLPTFLAGFFFVNMGVQTIMYLAALFGDVELHMPAESLIQTILILQLLAIGGALGFSRLATVIGEIRTLLLAVVLWIVVCLLAYSIKTANEFYGVAALVGLVMGGTQSMMRSTFASFIPENEKVKSGMFGFYDLLDKVSIVLGTAMYGLINELTGSMRHSSVALALFFLLGGIILLFVRRRARGFLQ